MCYLPELHFLVLLGAKGRLLLQRQIPRGQRITACSRRDEWSRPETQEAETPDPAPSPELIRLIFEYFWDDGQHILVGGGKKRRTQSERACPAQNRARIFKLMISLAFQLAQILRRVEQ